MNNFICDNCGCSGGYSATEGGTCPCGGTLHVAKETPVRQILSRVTLPKRVATKTETPRPGGNVRERFDATIAAVRDVDMDAGIRETTLLLLETFRSRVVPPLKDLEAALRVAKGDTALSVPLPTFEGIDRSGRVHLRLRSSAVDADIYIGQGRSVEYEVRGAFQIPESQGELTTSEKMLKTMFNRGTVGEA